MTNEPRTNSRNVPTIGLTGGVGAGKSTVATILRELGSVVSDSDRDARAVLANPEVLAALRAWWGDEVIDEDGLADRSAIASRIFSDKEARVRLERLVHPQVHERRQQTFAAATDDATALVIDAPLLFEAGLDVECDAVIFVDAPWEVRLSHVQEGRGWNRAELERREAAQFPIDEKRSKATDVISNDLGRAELAERVRVALESIVARFQGS